MDAAGCNHGSSPAVNIDNSLRYHQNPTYLSRLLLANVARQLALLIFIFLSFSDSVAQFSEAGKSLPSVPAGAQVTSERYTVSAKTLGISAKARKHLAAAHKEFRKMNVDEALRHIDAALQTDPSCAQAFSMRAFIRLAKKDPRGAAEDARHAMTLDSDDAESFIALAMSYNFLKEFQKAEEAVWQALSLRPQSWQGRLELAKSFYGQGEFVLALQELDLEKINFPDAHLVRGNVLIHLGRNQEAGEEFRVFLQQDPGDPRAQQVNRIISTLLPGMEVPPISN